MGVVNISKLRFSIHGNPANTQTRALKDEGNSKHTRMEIDSFTLEEGFEIQSAADILLLGKRKREDNEQEEAEITDSKDEKSEPKPELQFYKLPSQPLQRSQRNRRPTKKAREQMKPSLDLDGYGEEETEEILDHVQDPDFYNQDRRFRREEQKMRQWVHENIPSLAPRLPKSSTPRTQAGNRRVSVAVNVSRGIISRQDFALTFKGEKNIRFFRSPGTNELLTVATDVCCAIYTWSSNRNNVSNYIAKFETPAQKVKLDIFSRKNQSHPYDSANYNINMLTVDGVKALCAKAKTPLAAEFLSWFESSIADKL